ncbi:MAG: hypothetical protein WBC93_20485 [Sulfitobacter sp.]
MPKGRRSDIEASVLYQAVLDKLSQAYLDQDFETIRAHVVLPFTRRTLCSETLLETDEDLIRGASAFSRALQGLGVNQFIRLVTDAEFLSPDYIEGHHVTHTLRNAVRVFPSYSDRFVLKRDNGCWKITEHDSALNNSKWPFDVLSFRGQDTTLRGIERQFDDVRRTAAEPFVLYQNFLDALTITHLQNDINAYCALCSFPYSAHCGTKDTDVISINEVQPFFGMVSEMIGKYAIDDVKRSASRAEFISGNRICGYHTTTYKSGGKDVVDPIGSRMILERVGTKWLLKSVTNALSDECLPFEELTSTGALLTLQEIQERNRV